ncbi:hypothetical protein MHC_00420 [Mycoplasma haemocanis str. Illinois]|uniref:Uncharacterized protein n=1 Tax=Mycoplasma haemocanis (strain Illinois) TaxID=1111676 RepID=H6N5J0_MYCHN|nr:hypothetical protein [Mycoplasma haemocanis]AEW44950.1 hypothetical protein MHC_00420 [Mycoplasma haemocanis str. Illinois]
MHNDIRVHLKYLAEILKDTLNKMVFMGKIEFPKKLEAYSNLFKGDFKDPFVVPLTEAEWQDIKEIAPNFKGNRELQSSIKNIKRTLERQQFRNLSILKLMDEKLNLYMHVLETNKQLTLLTKSSQDEVSYISKDFKKRREMGCQYIHREVKNVTNLTKNQVIVNDIGSYIDMFTDFAVKELEHLTHFIKVIRGIVDETIVGEKLADLKTRIRTGSFDLPSFRQYMKLESSMNKK